MNRFHNSPYKKFHVTRFISQPLFEFDKIVLFFNKTKTYHIVKTCVMLNLYKEKCQI